MGETDGLLEQELIAHAPGGVAKIAFDETMTILNATDNFYSMITTAKAKSQVKGLLKTAYSGDIIYINKQLAQQKATLKDGFTLDFRTLQADGSFKWVMVSGKPVGEMYQEKYPIMACVIVDITNQKERQKQLEEKESYSRITTDLARDINFEYSIATDTLVFSELFHEVFGTDARVKNFRSKLEGTKLIHPEELNGVKKIFNSMMGGKKQTIFEFRMIPRTGEAVRYRCYASIIFDENKNPFRLVGKLALVYEAKGAKQADAAKPVSVTIDSSTGLPDIGSTIALLSDAIIKQPDNESSALIVMELGKYKEMDQLIRAISGDAFIPAVAEDLKRTVRGSDIVGMIGKENFVILLKNISSVDSVLTTADDICRKFKIKYQKEFTLSQPEVFIGIDLFKGHNALYETYISNALVALENAKKLKVSNIQIFSGKI